MKTKKYISAVEAISLLAYGETERLSKILDAEANYQKWKISGSENLLASFQRLADGHKPEGVTDVHAAYLVTTFEKPAQKLRAELEQDMRIREEYPYDHERVVKFHNLFIEAIRCGRLPIDGARRGGNGNIEKIPEEFTRRQGYGINIFGSIRIRNSFCFERKKGQSISRDDARKAGAVDEWEDLQVEVEGVRKMMTDDGSKAATKATSEKLLGDFIYQHTRDGRLQETKEQVFEAYNRQALLEHKIFSISSPIFRKLYPKMKNPDWRAGRSSKKQLAK